MSASPLRLLLNGINDTDFKIEYHPVTSNSRPRGWQRTSHRVPRVIRHPDPCSQGSSKQPETLPRETRNRVVQILESKPMTQPSSLKQQSEAEPGIKPKKHFDWVEICSYSKTSWITRCPGRRRWLNLVREFLHAGI